MIHDPRIEHWPGATGTEPPWLVSCACGFRTRRPRRKQAARAAERHLRDLAVAEVVEGTPLPEIDRAAARRGFVE